MTVARTALFLLIAVTPTAIGIVFITAPRWIEAIGRLVSARRGPAAPEPSGPPIEQLAADLRRLIRLHGELGSSAHLATRAHRLWSVEAAIGARAVEAAQALGVPHRVPPPGTSLTRDELSALLSALTAAGLVLPATARF
jgi:hypothetical protein